MIIIAVSARSCIMNLLDDPRSSIMFDILLTIYLLYIDRHNSLSMRSHTILERILYVVRHNNLSCMSCTNRLLGGSKIVYII